MNIFKKSCHLLMLVELFVGYSFVYLEFFLIICDTFSQRMVRFN